jgi:hypothetical protein
MSAIFLIANGWARAFELAQMVYSPPVTPVGTWSVARLWQWVLTVEVRASRGIPLPVNLSKNSGTVQLWRPAQWHTIRFVQAFRLVGVSLIAAIGFIPLAPAEHVHEFEEHGTHQKIVHRHSEGHAALDHSAGHHGVVDHDDALILMLPTVYTVPTAPADAASPEVAIVGLLEPPLARRLHPGTEFIERLIHGPPRATASLRAPPSSLTA